MGANYESILRVVSRVLVYVLLGGLYGDVLKVIYDFAGKGGSRSVCFIIGGIALFAVVGTLADSLKKRLNLHPMVVWFSFLIPLVFVAFIAQDFLWKYFPALSHEVD
jgi:hypothetical protein